ncbi:hypothetical protein [Rickettsiales endosymbiont of Trichoplax sp. H2]|uniref:hypothetical protein n=1 Tax=Rickettsiales endosymbiont of Trichoplax sp. H2 TaxID=2021221 RepID=UPI0012B2403F|nr:hypothetical protein [Rickettsiales endosymbiont of Trichoplax sp. H2]MSO13504.1 hypothetical protein [Rickettsiales endosymbiont of Trichoplax sp. H2]
MKIMRRLLKNHFISLVIISIILFISIIGYKVTVSCVNNIVKEKEGLINAEELNICLKCITDKAMNEGKKLLMPELALNNFIIIILSICGIGIICLLIDNLNKK